MEPLEILNEWAGYSKYDETQRSFNLNSVNYLYHETGDFIKAIMGFDPSGIMALLFAKDVFMQVCKTAEVKVIDLFKDPHKLDEDLRMWELFSSESISEIEQKLLDSMDCIVQKVIETKAIGERDREKEKGCLYQSINTVVKELLTCHEEVYKSSELPIVNITKFSTHIHVFNTMSECVLTIEQGSVDDGMYLCFIRNGDRADCFFCFMVKSNGNVFAVSERVSENFPGQHGCSRNGRWSDDKKYHLFPYEYIFGFGEYDYKGYASMQMIDDRKLAFFNLGPEVYMPLILAMICIGRKYDGIKLSNENLMLIDTLLRWNAELPSPAAAELMIPSDSAIVKRIGDYVIPFDSEGIRDWKYGMEHKHSKAHGAFPDHENIFAALYGDGFVLDTKKILVTDPHLRISDRKTNDKLIPNPEYIMTREWFDLIAYRDGRQQYADHIRKKMFEEFLNFGNADGIRKWWKKAIDVNHDRIIAFCAEKYEYVKNGGADNVYDFFWESDNPEFLSCISMMENDKHCGSGYHPFNKKKKNKYGFDSVEFYEDALTGSLCTINFRIRPRNDKELEALFGKLPKILIGWKRNGHTIYGNSILDITDPVSDIGNICERNEQECYYKGTLRGSWESDPEKGAYIAPQTSFDFCVSFSRRGLKKAMETIKK